MNTTQLSELDRIKLKIKALAAKTVENGATEQEALSAMAGVGRLLSQYNLSMNEIDVRQSSFKTIFISCGRKRRHPIDGCVLALTALIDGKCWFNRNYTKASTYAFFGEAHDLELVEYLFRVIWNALHTEAHAFKTTDFYVTSDNKKSAFTSFQHGMASRISVRLRQMKKENDAAMNAAPTGTAVLVLKKQLIEEEFEKTGPKLTSYTDYKRITSFGAYGAGQNAGDKVNLSRPLKKSGGNVRGLLK